MEMLVIEPLTTDMHVVNALHAKNFSMTHSDNAIVTDIKMAIAATFKLVAIEKIITKATMVPISARLACDWAFPWG